MRCLYCHNRDTWDTHGGKEITVEELMKEVVTYRHFMNASGGGVTARGGDAAAGSIHKVTIGHHLFH
ncbi:4Fe-4S cluster-binding domain-containing protein [Klebsiella pneumoniae]|uniref:4Fe-4S cluster-binding domain-containing protein n=1 Tax=Klebsiella pneumoniae TaxID=573 RepID=UPI003528F8BC